MAKKYYSKLHGIDYSPEMIRMAKQSLIETEILAEIHFEVQDCLDLKFPNN